MQLSFRPSKRMSTILKRKEAELDYAAIKYAYASMKNNQEYSGKLVAPHKYKVKETNAAN